MLSVKNLVQTFDNVTAKRWAGKESLRHFCKRKIVSCGIGALESHGFRVFIQKENGPSSTFPCRNIVGGCGCSHAEPRALLEFFREYGRSKDATYEDYLAFWQDNHLTMFCAYSPCTNCANIIVDSKVIQAVVYGIATLHDMTGIKILRRGKVGCWSANTVLGWSNATLAARYKDLRNAKRFAGLKM